MRLPGVLLARAGRKGTSVTYLKTAAAILLLTAAPAFAQQPPAPPEPPVVVTSGEGVIEVVPDRAWITVTAESRAGNARDAQKRNVDAMTPVLDKVKAAGVPAEAIKTVGYDLQQEWDYVNNRRISRGYVARNTVEIRVDNVERVGELLEIAVGSGATSVGGIRFDVKDRDKLEADALRLAVAEARRLADAAAAGAGRTIERVQRIDAQRMGGPVPMPRVAYAREQAAAADSAAPPISAGQIEIRAHVTLTSVLK
jgi:uncharacterized protein YggE